MGLTDLLKTDIAHDGGLVVTPAQDIGTVSGLANFKLAIWHRLITVPGTYVHRPTYGIGIKTYQGALSSFTQQQKLASKIREQLAEDPRVDSVGNIEVVANDSEPQLTQIKIFVTPKGYTEQQITYTPFSGGVSI